MTSHRNTPGEATLDTLEDGNTNSRASVKISSASASSSTDYGKKGAHGGDVIYTRAQLVKASVCFAGLQISYIAWGVVQEQLMTQEYGGKKFTSSSFCVFGNRFFALIVALVIVVYQKYTDKNPKSDNDTKASIVEKPSTMPPFYAYAACAASNSLSSFAQYEALKFVSFPTQTLSKSCKIIPVMIVGILLNKKSYPAVEYLDALLITIGVGMFTLSEKANTAAALNERSDSIWGLALLAMYLTCDSFTSQWQSRIYKSYSLTQFQMMLGVNVWSMLFTGVTLARSGEGMTSFAFIMTDSTALAHMTILSITSATGQIFIYYTIKEFGPVVFTIMMTTRQIFSLFLSCILFSHPLHIAGWAGAIAVFFIIFNKIKRGTTNTKAFLAMKLGIGGV